MPALGAILLIASPMLRGYSAPVAYMQPTLSASKYTANSTIARETTSSGGAIRKKFGNFTSQLANKLVHIASTVEQAKRPPYHSA
eukprot:6092462-Amphidinium_carterae.1